MTWSYVILAYFCLLIFGLCDNIRGPLFPEILEQFKVGNSLGSWFFAMTSIFAFVGSWATMHTLKSIDRVQNIYMSLVLLGAGHFAVGISENFTQLMLATACTGLGFGFLGVSANILATVGANSTYRQRCVSGLHSMYGLSSVVAPLVVNAVYSLGGDWRQTFYVGGASCFILLVGGLIFLRNEKTVKTHSEMKKETGQKFSSRDSKLIAVASVMVGLYVVAEILVSSRLALYLRIQKSYDLIQSGFYVTGFFIFLLAGRLLFSFYQPKIKISYQLYASLGSTLVVMLLGLYLHESFLMLTGFFMGPYYPLVMTYISDCFPGFVNRALATVIATQSFFLVLMHVGSGWLTDTLGISGAMISGPFVLLISAILLFGFNRWKNA